LADLFIDDALFDTSGPVMSTRAERIEFCKNVAGIHT